MSRIRGALSLAGRRKRQPGLLDCVDSMTWHVRPTEKYNALVDTSAQLYPSAIKLERGKMHIYFWSERRTQQLTVLKA